MSWILLLIQLIPTLIKIWEAIREAIAKRPRAERPALRAEVRAMARRQVRDLALVHASFISDPATGPKHAQDYSDNLKDAIDKEWHATYARIKAIP